MQLKRLPTKETIGLILAHSTNLKNKRISKGTLLDSDIVRSLINAEISEVTCAVPDKGDIHEDEAANLIAMAIDKKKSFLGSASTGRVNFKAYRPLARHRPNLSPCMRLRRIYCTRYSYFGKSVSSWCRCRYSAITQRPSNR
mgnify:CR=1 FL=1